MPVSTIPRISTVMLSWNRIHLLKECIISYLKTASVPVELIIIDNHSTDGATSFIKNICQKHRCCRCILLPRNEGGRALNYGLSQARGNMLHVSENDLIYKPGWDHQVIDKFTNFPELGQLSLFSPFFNEPERITFEKEEGREQEGNQEEKQAGHKYYHHEECRNERTIYVTDRNVGTSSVFRKILWNKGLRWRNVGQNLFRFPDDYAFSTAVQKAGYLVAWNDIYLVENRGHSIAEFENNLPYYLNNYRSKQGGLNRFQIILNNLGYRLARENSGEYKIIPL